jgi:hypothetical protein
MKQLLLIFLLCLFPLICHPATYYIDYNAANDSANGTAKETPWKRAPGMKGFAGSYTHAAGDVFIFKGGVTWPAAALPLTIGYSGTAGNIDTYTVDQTWYTGGAYDYPVFNGNNSLGANSYIIGDNSVSQSYILINGLKLIKTWGTDGTGSTAKFTGGGNSIEISNCYLSPEAIEAFSYNNSSGAKSKVYIHDNYITNAGRAVVYSRTGSTLDDVRIYNNTYVGVDSTSLGGFHLDGFMVGDANTTNCTNGGVTTITNILVYNNKFSGLWPVATAQFYSNGCTSNLTFYNNQFALENSTGQSGCLLPDGAIYLRHDGGTMKFYNNTFSSDSVPGMSGGMKYGIFIGTPTDSATIDIRNNIFSGLPIDVEVTTGYGSLTMDYNLHNPSTAGGYGYPFGIGASFKTWAQTLALGYEAHSPTPATPKFVAVADGTAGSGNWQLQSDSPAIDVGTDLSAAFTTDILGLHRPANVGAVAWDIGAYEKMLYSRGTLGSGPAVTIGAGAVATIY